jgi:hypothetical protein
MKMLICFKVVNWVPTTINDKTLTEGPSPLWVKDLKIMFGERQVAKGKVLQKLKTLLTNSVKYVLSMCKLFPFGRWFVVSSLREGAI